MDLDRKQNQTREQKSQLQGELARLKKLRQVNRQLEQQLRNETGLDSEQLKKIVQQMQLEQGLISVDHKSLSSATDDKSQDQYQIIHIVESSNGDEPSAELRVQPSEKKQSSPYQPSARKVAFDAYMAQKESLGKLLTKYLKSLPGSPKLQKLINAEKMKRKQQNYLQMQMYNQKNYNRSRKNIIIPDPNLVRSSQAQLHQKETRLNNKKSQRTIVVDPMSPRGTKHDGLLNPSYNLKLEPTILYEDQTAVIDDDLLRIEQIINGKDPDPKRQVSNADLDALELKETEKLIENIMSMQIRITEEVEAQSKEEESRTANVDDGTGTLGANPTPRQTFTIAKDLPETPLGQTVDERIDTKENPEKILQKSITTIQLGADSSIQQEQTLQSINLNRNASAHWSRNIQSNFNQVSPKMIDVVNKKSVRVLSLGQAHGIAASGSLRGSSQLSHLAAQSPNLRPININSNQMDDRSNSLGEIDRSQIQNQDLVQLQVKKGQPSPFVSGQAITLQSIVKQPKSKKDLKDQSNRNMRSIKVLQRVSSNIRSSKSLHKSNSNQKVKQNDPADWWKGGLADITDVAESKSNTKHGSMGAEMGITGQMAYSNNYKMSAQGSITQRMTKLQVEIEGAQTPFQDQLTPYASGAKDAKDQIQNSQKTHELSNEGQSYPESLKHASLASLKEFLIGPNAKPSLYNSLHGSSQISLKKNSIQEAFQRNSDLVQKTGYLTSKKRSQDQDLIFAALKITDLQINQWPQKHSPKVGEFSFRELTVPTANFETHESPGLSVYNKGNEGLRSPKSLSSHKAKYLGGKSPQVKTIQEVLDKYISQQTKQERKQQEMQKYVPQKMENLRLQERNYYNHQNVLTAAQQNQISRVYQLLEQQLSDESSVPKTAEGLNEQMMARKASQSSLLSAKSIPNQEYSFSKKPDIQIQGQVVDLKKEQKVERDRQYRLRGKQAKKNKTKIQVLGINPRDKQKAKETLSDDNQSPFVPQESPKGELEAQREIVEMVKIVEQKRQKMQQQNNLSVLEQVHQFEAQLESKQEKAKESENIKIGSQIIKKPQQLAQKSPNEIEQPNYGKIEDESPDIIRAILPSGAQVSSFEISQSKEAPFTPWKGQTGYASPTKIPSQEMISKLTTIKSKASIGALKVLSRQSGISKDDEVAQNKDIIQIINMKGGPKKNLRLMTLGDHEDQGTQLRGAPISSLAGSSPHQESSINLKPAIKTQSALDIAPYAANTSFDRHLTKDRNHSSFQANISYQDKDQSIKKTEPESGLQIYIPASARNQKELKKPSSKVKNSGYEEEIVAVQSELGNSHTSWQAKGDTLDVADTAEGQLSKILDSQKPSRVDLHAQDFAKNSLIRVDSTDLKLVSQTNSIIQSVEQTGNHNQVLNQGLPSLSARVVIGSPGDNSQVSLTFQQSPRDYNQNDNYLEDGKPTLQSDDSQSRKSGEFLKPSLNNQINQRGGPVHLRNRNQVRHSLTTDETYVGNASQEASRDPKPKRAIKHQQSFNKRPSFVTFQTKQVTEQNQPDYLQSELPIRRRRNMSQFQIYIKDKLKGIEEGRLLPSLATPPNAGRARQAVPWNKKLTQIIGMSPLESLNMDDYPGSKLGTKRTSVGSVKPFRRNENLDSKFSQKLRSMRVYSTLAHGDEGKQPSIDIAKAFRNFKPVRNHNEQLKFELGLLKDGKMPERLGMSPSGLTLGNGSGPMLAMRTKEISETLIQRQKNLLLGHTSNRDMQTKHISLPKLKRQGIPLVQS